jgi:hypothetical protein
LLAGLAGACGSVLGNPDAGGTGGSGPGTGGHGGVSGTGGSGTGGSATGGAGGAGGGPSCGDLAAAYAAALPAAQSCDVSATGQCLQLVSGSLSPCAVNCYLTFVNDATALNAIRAAWQQAGCANVDVLCPAIACIQPSTGVCAPADGGGGVCTAALTPTN